MSTKTNKVVASITATALAASMLLGGTLAWQSISQEATNIVSNTVNPGGRLHDDFNGSNKDVYVENFADEPIYARIQLREYLLLGSESADESTVPTKLVTEGADYKDTDTWVTHYWEREKNPTDEYVSFFWGGETKYMPTFNMDKDSLIADINGTYDSYDETADDDGRITIDERYDDYIDYNESNTSPTKDAYEIKDIDFDTADQVGEENVEDLADLIENGTVAVNYDKYKENVAVAEATHTVAQTLNASVISMAEWLAMSADAQDAFTGWVYDTDGWAYWSQPIDAKEVDSETGKVTSNNATGLLLDRINTRIDDTYLYAIHVVGQFITANDIGSAEDGDGFYDMSQGGEPTPNALILLSSIGVEVPSAVSDVESLKTELAKGGDAILSGEVVLEATDATTEDPYFVDKSYALAMTEGGSLSGGTLTDESASDFGVFVNAEVDYPNEGDGASPAELNSMTISSNSTAAVYVQAIAAPVTLNNVTITGEKIGLYAEHPGSTVTLNGVTATSNNKATGNLTYQNAAVAAAGEANIVINSGTYTGDYAAYVYSSGGTITINGGHFAGALQADGDGSTIVITGGTFTADPSAFVAADKYDVTKSEDGIYTVTAKTQA